MAKKKKKKKGEKPDGARPKTYRKIFEFFDAPVASLDCGQKCAPLNGGSPVCCDVENAVPIMQVAEWKHLKKRTDMWRPFKPYDAATKQITEEIADTCKAVECRGAKHCERDNRSLACRTFPFFPYFTKDREILGLAYYWYFEDRCWVISNMAAVDQPFIDQFLKAYALLFKHDTEERDVFVDYSATMRRVFSRWNRPIPVIAPSGEFLMVLPKGKGVRKVGAAKLPKFEPFLTETD
jgi:hypothetical protein